MGHPSLLDEFREDLAAIEMPPSAREAQQSLVNDTPMAQSALWHAAGKAQAGPVFLSSRGQPWQDTTDKGGNPLRKAHATACRVAGVESFRVHDWRHDWAARMVMGGVDLYTLMRIGGWSSLKMVERYAAVSAEHLHAAMARIA